MNIITSDEKLFEYSARAKGRVVLVTGQVHTLGGRPEFASFSCYLHRRCRRTRPRSSDGIRDEWVPASLPTNPIRGSTRVRCSMSCFSRANVVIGDIYASGAQATVEAIDNLPPDSGKACWKRCDVSNWDDQVGLFEYAMTKFGNVDIVVSVDLLGCNRADLVLHTVLCTCKDRSPVPGLENFRILGRCCSRMGNPLSPISKHSM